MNDEIARAAAFLLQKMPAATMEGNASHYFFSRTELERALENPQGPPRFESADMPADWGDGWMGPIDGGVTYWAQYLMMELSELGDENTELAEYRELQSLLEEAGYPCDRGKMSEEEYYDISGAVQCPLELNDEMLSVLNQRVKPN